MQVFLGIVLVLVIFLLILIAAVRPLRTTMSHFELRRRSEQGDSEAKQRLRREALLGDVISLQRVVLAILQVVVGLVSVAALGWWPGVLLAILIAFEYNAVARLRFFRKIADTLFHKIEPHILHFTERAAPIFKVIRGIESSSQLSAASSRPDSREELQYIIQSASEDVLAADDKKMLIHSMAYRGTLVSETMTPRSVIDSIEKAELLGPLVLDDLHKTGHSRIPVTDGDIDHIVGILYMQDLLTLDRKKSLTAEKAMNQKVFYIREDQTLHEALTAFITTHHHLFIVVNEYRETVGVLSLEDVIEAMIGAEIVDEFDAHDDLRVVAARNVRHNNSPKNHKDV